nr:MAG TPA_asm: hypothetical protein [Caudoviricetes sp.]
MVTIAESLKQYTNGVHADTDPIDRPVHQLIAEALYKLANTANPKKRGSLRQATAAQRIILDRTVGKRLPGSNPAARSEVRINFVDLTAGAISAEEERHGTGSNEETLSQSDS